MKHNIVRINKIVLSNFKNVKKGIVEMPAYSGKELFSEKADVLGLYGQNGSGKTSVVNLIPRFYDATQGNVLVFGKPVKEQDMESLRSQIAIVPQKAVLFAGTIRENMKWGKEDATDEEIMEALTIAQAAEVVQKKEGGLDAFVEQGGKNLSMFIDLKPALSEEQLDHRLLREFDEAKNKQFKNSIGGLFPAKMIPVMLELSGIDPEKKVNEITKAERRYFIGLIKAFPVTLCGLRDFNEAIITKGGVKVKEVNPSTMESKLVPHLYFCGEVLDLDAMTGGYNLQIAWSTGYLAGVSAAQTEK